MQLQWIQGCVDRLSVRKALSVVGALAFVACQGGSAGSGDSSAMRSDSGAKVADSSTMKTMGPVGLSGAPDTNGNRTQNYLDNHVDFASTQALVTDFTCDSVCNGSRHINLTVKPSAESPDVDWVATLTDRRSVGHFLVKITNSDRFRMGDLHLDPGESAYLWIGQLKQAERTRAVAFYKVLDNQVSGPFEIQNQLQYCDDVQSSPRAKVTKKRDHPDSECWRIGKLGSKPRDKFPQDGLWTSCSNGCCQIEGGVRLAIDTPDKPKPD